VVINDTVGFIRDLPKDLLAAFGATLEEIRDSDLLVHVVDAAHPGREAQIVAVDGILRQLGYAEIPRLLIFNKGDLVDEPERAERVAGRDAIVISSTTELGIPELLRRIDDVLPFRARAAVAEAAATHPIV
jgi:GTP-binding protein HflX